MGSDPSTAAYEDANLEEDITRIKTFASDKRLQQRGELIKQALLRLDVEVELVPEIGPGY